MNITHEVKRPPTVSRYWEVDALRGIAVFMMIFYHTLFDINYLGIAGIPVGTGPLRLLAMGTVSIFLLLVGVSLTLSRHRHVKEGGGPEYRSFIRRGLKILAIAGIITLVTYLVVPEEFIVFGVLHCIGIAVIIGPLFIRFGIWNLIGGIVWILLGLFLSTFSGPYWLLWAGIAPEGFSSLDYVPILPWFGMVMFGIAGGTLLYPSGRRAFNIADPPSRLSFPLLWSGRHSLLIYLIHQPLLLGALGILFPSGMHQLLPAMMLVHWIPFSPPVH